MSRGTIYLDPAGTHFDFRFNYSAPIVQAVKLIPGRRWSGDDKAWYVPIESAPQVRAFLASFRDFAVDPDAAAILDNVDAAVAYNVFVDTDARLLIFRGGYLSAAVDAIREIKGRKWNSDTKEWTVPAKEADAFRDFVVRFNLRVEPAAEPILQAWGDEADLLRGLSRAETAELDVPGLADGYDLFPYQKAGVLYTQAAGGRSFIGDEPGLGKSLQALAAAEITDRWPVVIIVPTVVETHWRREIAQFFPHRTSLTLRGQKPRQIGHADYIIIGYPVVAYWLDAILNAHPQGLVVDESHMCKGTTQRTKAVKAIAGVGSNERRANTLTGAVPHDGMVLLLTGTPILNSTAELVHQLLILGRLGDFGGWKGFTERYVKLAHLDDDAQKERRRLLNEHLRATCLPGDASIVTEHDGTQTIRHLANTRYRGRVLADAGDGTWCWSRVTGHNVKRNDGAIVRLSIGDAELDTTADHRIYVEERGWCRADAITIGNHVRILSDATRQRVSTRRQASQVLLEVLHRKGASCAQPRRPETGYEGMRVVREHVPVSVVGSILLAEMFGTLAVRTARPLRRVDSGRYDARSNAQRQAGKETHDAESVTRYAHPRRTTRADQPDASRQTTDSGHRPDIEASNRANARSRMGARMSRMANLRRYLALVCRPCRRPESVSDRSRWGLAPTDPATEGRSLQGEAATRARVDRIEILQPDDRRVACRGDGDDPRLVYDLEIADVHNFVADGVVVHNCLVRRRKLDVLKELPPKRRVFVWVEPDPVVMREYEKAEADLLEYLAERARAVALALGLNPEHEAVMAKMKAQGAEALVRINVLRQLSAKAKLGSAIEWARTFAESGESLGIYAHHRAIVDGLADSLSAGRIMGGQVPADRQRVIDDFQAKRTLTAVLSIAAAGVGITLTAASNALFVEQAWNPGTLTQAEDRHHRIGQAESVTVFYLLAEGTLDADMMALIGAKRAEVDNVTDGADVEVWDDTADPQAVLAGRGSVASEMIERLTRRALGAPEVPLPAPPAAAEQLQAFA